jgi:signal transduction histidine kinase
MKFLGKLLFVACFVFTAAGIAQAGERGSPDEARAMAEKAAKVIEAKGIDAAVQAFHAPGGDFHDRDLYVFVFAKDGVTKAHGAKETLVGRNMMGLRDVDGKQIVKEFLKVSDTGWVDYKWQHPKTEKVEAKTSYIIKVGEYWVGVGAYKS